MKRKLIFLAAAILIQPTIVLAAGQSLASIGLKCSDFQKNPDGTWSPTHMVTVSAGGAKISFSSKQIIGPDTRAAAYQLGVMVNIECGEHSSTDGGGTAPR
jgi:hypothetical protein